MKCYLLLCLTLFIVAPTWVFAAQAQSQTQRVVNEVAALNKSIRQQKNASKWDTISEISEILSQIELTLKAKIDAAKLRSLEINLSDVKFYISNISPLNVARPKTIRADRESWLQQIDSISTQIFAITGEIRTAFVADVKAVTLRILEASFRASAQRERAQKTYQLVWNALNKAEISYAARVGDLQPPTCSHAKPSAGGLIIETDYVGAFAQGNKIYLCSRAFAMDLYQLSDLMLHEAAHVAGYLDECDATKIQVSAMNDSGIGIKIVSGYVAACKVELSYRLQ